MGSNFVISVESWYSTRSIGATDVESVTNYSTTNIVTTSPILLEGDIHSQKIIEQ